MDMRNKFLAFVALTLLAGSVSAGAAKGSCVSKARSIASSQSVTLVAEYDPEEKETWDNGVQYYKANLTRGRAYTIWISGGNAANIDLDVYTDDEYYDDREDEPSAGFDVDELDGGAIKVAYLYADDWDLEEDPKTGRFIIELDGEIGAGTTLNFVSGIKTFTQIGSSESPKTVSFSTSWKTVSAKMIDGEYYMSASLKAGRKYRVNVTGGKAGATLGLGVSAYKDEMEEPTVQTDEQYSNAYNEGLIVVPSESGKHFFIADGDTSQSFRFRYQMVPTRAIASHVSIPLLPENGYESKFVPGRIANTQSYYDEIIDEHLCRIYLNKGERWVFETSGATNYIQMVAYNSAGKVLATNESFDGEDFDCRVVVTASTAGVYYIGVCDPTLDVEDVPNGAQITLSARNTADMLPADEWDPVDDTYAKATFLTAAPATTNFTIDASAFVSGPHRLAANDHYDCYALLCRKGMTYQVTGEFSNEDDPVKKLTLASKVFYISSGSEKSVTATGSLTPYAVNRDDPLTFKAPVSGVIYIRVWVSEGRGLDFSPYGVSSTVVSGDTRFGMLKFLAQGANGTYSLNAETVKYPAGGVLSLATNASLKVVFNSPSGFTVSPASQTVAIPLYADGDEPVTVTARYTDVYDTKYQTGTKTVVAKNGTKKTEKIYSPADGDATPAGAFAITPAAAAATVTRTLWADDPADHFRFTAATNVYYNLKLGASPYGDLGDAKMVVSNALVGVVFEGAELEKALLPTGATYVVVSHANAPAEDSCYTLTYSRAATGLVKFTASSFTATEGSEYATLTVARTGTEGAVKVRYFTEAATAVPGTNYYPVTDGVISWASGDKANKSIKIRLIPELTPSWASSNLFFNVKLAPVDEYGLDSGEYLSRFSLDAAKVVIKEATAKKPGTISLAAYGEGLPTDVRITNVKSPVAKVQAKSVKADGGTPVVLTFERTGGANGKVSVKVATSPLKTDTAVAGTDYATTAQTLVWEDGDAEPKQVTLTVYKRSAADYTASRKFNLAVTAVKTGTVPTLSSAKATVTVVNDLVAQTGAAYAKTLPASGGVTLTTTGTWFADYDATFRSASSAGKTTFTVTGPGLFVCQPEVVIGDAETDAATLTCQINKEAAFNVTNVVDGRIVKILGAGKSTVTFSLTGVKGGAYARFTPQVDGKPYSFTAFKSTVPAWPMNKAVVETNLTTLAWTVPAAVADEPGLYTRVRFGTTATPATALAYGEATQADTMIPEGAPAAGKTYYWTVDYAYTNATGLAEEEIKSLKWTNGPTVWSFSALKNGAPVSRIAGGTDAAGESVADRIAAGEPVELIQALKPDFAMAGEGSAGMAANRYRLVAGSLPKGVTINATTGKLTGCPSAVGSTVALLQSYNQTTTSKKVNGKVVKTTVTTYGTTIPVRFDVLPAGTALGTWRGWIEETSGTFPKDSRHTGDLTLSVTSAGKITAKATVAGVVYSFVGTTGYDELTDRVQDDAKGDFRRFRVALKNTTTIAKKNYTNYLTLEIDDGALTNAAALAQAAASVELQMQVANSGKTSVTPDISYAGTLVRNDGGAELGKTALASFAGYYTLGLVPSGVAAADGLPLGSGYLTLTVGATGSVKVSGVLADGASVSFSTIASVVGEDLSDVRNCKLVIPCGYSKSTFALSGNLTIAYENADAELPVVLPEEMVLWMRNASSAVTRDAVGFGLDLAPTGGWYDKVANLQAYYLGTEFSVKAADSDDLPSEALASGYAFSTSDAVQEFLAVPDGLNWRFVGNAAKVDARKLVKNKTTGLYDFSQSVNPWNTTVKFTRATGIITGTFSAWEWNFKSDDIQDFAYRQKEITKLTHKGVWLFSRDGSASSPLREDAVSAGFFQMPTTGKWKASLPFSVIANPVENDWFENEEP